MTFEVVSKRNIEFHAQITDNHVTGFKQIDIERTAVRLYRNGRIAIAGTTGTAHFDELRNKAVSALDRGITYPCEPSSGLKKQVILGNELMSRQLFAKQCDDFMGTLRSQFPNFVFSNKIRMVQCEKSIRNERELDLSFFDRYYSCEILFKRLGSKEIIDGALHRSFRENPFEGMLALAREKLTAFDSECALPHGKDFSVIWPEEDNELLYFFWKELNGRQFATGTSLLSGKLGRQLFSTEFNLVHDSSADCAAGSAFFDSEGVVTSNFQFPLIEKGVLRAPFTDKRTAQEFSLPLTGSAGGAYDEAPNVEGFTPRALATHQSLRDILGGQTGILIESASGGDFDSAGRFASPVQCAYLHDGERILGRLPEFEVSGSVYDLFGRSFRGVCHNNPQGVGLGGFVVTNMEITRE